MEPRSKARLRPWVIFLLLLLAVLILAGTLFFRAVRREYAMGEIAQICALERVSGREQYLEVPVRYVIMPNYLVTKQYTRFMLSGTIEPVAEAIRAQLGDAVRLSITYDETADTGFLLLDFGPNIEGRYLGIFFLPPGEEHWLGLNRYLARYTDLWADFMCTVQDEPYRNETVVSVLFPWHFLQNYMEISSSNISSAALDRAVATLAGREEYLAFYDTLWQYTTQETDAGFLLSGCDEETLLAHTGSTQRPEWYPSCSLEFVFSQTEAGETLLVRAVE